jgi:hypothetical protein
MQVHGVSGAKIKKERLALREWCSENSKSAMAGARGGRLQTWLCRKIAAVQELSSLPDILWI